MYAAYDFKAGDASAAMCPHCHKPVATRYEHRTIQLARTRLRVRDVLVPVCTECDHTVAIPRQSWAPQRAGGGGA